MRSKKKNIKEKELKQIVIIINFAILLILSVYVIFTNEIPSNLTNEVTRNKYNK